MYKVGHKWQVIKNAYCQVADGQVAGNKVVGDFTVSTAAQWQVNRSSGISCLCIFYFFHTCHESDICVYFAIIYCFNIEILVTMGTIPLT